MTHTFQRAEYKFLLTPEQYEALTAEFSQQLVPDRFFRYRIFNLYYDTPDCELLRRSAQHPVYKEKLRLRSYGLVQGEDSKVYLEIKKKFDGVVYKRRIPLTLRQAEALLADPDDDSAVVETDRIHYQEIRYLLQRLPVQPTVYLSYDREACTWAEDPNLRITFDSDIRFRLSEVDLRAGDAGTPLLPAELRLMEVKAQGSLPIPFVRALCGQNIRPVSFSKVGTVYQQYILQPQNLQEVAL